jgi:hypothetical protein
MASVRLSAAVAERSFFISFIVSLLLLSSDVGLVAEVVVLNLATLIWIEQRVPDKSNPILAMD